MTKKNLPPMVQLYDVVEEQVYKRIVPGLIFSHKEVVRTEATRTELVLEIATQRIPDKIILNGKPLKI